MCKVELKPTYLEQTMVTLVERNTKLLGTEARLEKLVDWSNTSVKGSEIIQKSPCGLLVKAVANKDRPRVVLYWNQYTFNSLINTFDKRLAHLHVNVEGVSINYKNGTTLVTLVCAGKKLKLFEYKESNGRVSDTDLLCGSIQIAESLSFLNRTETLVLPAVVQEPTLLNTRVGTASVEDLLTQNQNTRKTNWLGDEAILDSLLAELAVTPRA